MRESPFYRLLLDVSQEVAKRFGVKKDCVSVVYTHPAQLIAYANLGRGWQRVPAFPVSPPQTEA